MIEETDAFRTHGAVCRNEIGYRVEDFHAIRLQERGLAANTAPKNGEKGKGGKGRKSAKAAAAAAATAASAGTADASATGTPNGNRGDRRNGAAVPATPGNGAAKSANTDGGKSDGAGDESLTEDDGPGGDRTGDGSDGGGAEDEEQGGDDGEDEDVAKDGMNAWWNFMYFSRVGLRRFLGMDSLGRRYWLMAGRAGAYQVRHHTSSQPRRRCRAGVNVNVNVSTLGACGAVRVAGLSVLSGPRMRVCPCLACV